MRRRHIRRDAQSLRHGPRWHIFSLISTFGVSLCIASPSERTTEELYYLIHEHRRKDTQMESRWNPGGKGHVINRLIETRSLA